MGTLLLNVARTLARSAANGPGERFVVWVQGCTLRCSGCWNRDTWSRKPQRVVSSQALAQEILQTAGIEGITLTGGEPFEQAEALAELAEQIQRAGLSVVTFTGFERHELGRPEQQRLINLCDVVVTGRYVRERRTFDLPWRGSSNQTVHFLSNRYSAASAEVSICEAHLGPNGEIILTGFPPDELVDPFLVNR